MNDTIILQNSAGAFLENNGYYLLMKRSSERKIAPNVWSCVGGHMESNEINNPKETCLREIEEETGITKDHIFNLKLRYIIIRLYKNIIRQSYIYFGKTDVKEYIDTEEGTLHWILEKDLLNKEYSKTYTEMMKHYIKTPDKQKRVIICVAENNLGVLKMNWSILEDFEKIVET
jgi:8-oxo-dGTP diphosphatase